MHYLLMLLFLFSCARNPIDIGSIVRTKSWQCVKSDINPGISFSGDLVISSSCSVSKCFETETRLGEYFWQDTVISSRMIPDENCIK